MTRTLKATTTTATALLRDDRRAQLRRLHLNKRHPDLEDQVTVYPNATILGGGTRIGHHSAIGGSVWLTHSVAPYSKVVGKEVGVADS